MHKKTFLLFLIGAMALSACGTFDMSVDYGAATAASSSDQLGGRELGWVTLTGTLRDSAGMPLAGESVMCQQVSNYSTGLCSGTRYTTAGGKFSFGSIFLHAADTLILWAIPSSYELKEIKRAGVDVWKQPDFEFVYPVEPTPPFTELSAGDLGWTTIAGTVRDVVGTPLAGATVFCQFVSGSSNRQTNTRGNFSCGTVFLRDAETISVQVIAAGFPDQVITRSGLEIRQNPAFNFIFSHQVTPTPDQPNP